MVDCFLMVLAKRPLCDPLCGSHDGPELAISVDTYIWAVCSSKRNSHAVRLNPVGNKTRLLYQQILCAIE